MSSFSLLMPLGEPFDLDGKSVDLEGLSKLFTTRHSPIKLAERGWDLSVDPGTYQFYDFQRSTNDAEISLAMSVVSVTYRAGAVLKAIEKFGGGAESFRNIIAFSHIREVTGRIVKRSLIVCSDSECGSDDVSPDKLMIDGNETGQCLSLYAPHSYRVLACTHCFK